MTTDLTTPSKVKAYLRQTSLGDAGEEAIQDFIRIASRLVRKTTERAFSTPRALQTREFRTYGRHEVYVDELLSAEDIVSVTDESGMGLLYDADFEEHRGPVMGATITLTPFEYDGYGGIKGLPADHSDLFIRELRTTGVGWVYPKKVVVEGYFGYEPDEIPEEIEFATRRAAALWFKEEIAHYTDDAFISRGNRFEPEELPPLSMAVLRGGGWIVEDPVVV